MLIALGKMGLQVDELCQDTEKEREDLRQAIRVVVQELDRKVALRLAMRRFIFAKQEGYLH